MNSNVYTPHWRILMNKKIITMAMVLALPLTVFAMPGEDNGAGGKHANRLEKMAKKLDLTDDQKAKLDVIFKEQHAKQKALRKETRELVNHVLTAVQMEKMQEMKKRRQQKRKDNKAVKSRN
jgi:Spy/CpxP family protein refolding chaperone